jgi:hypothetical protein
MIKAIETKYNGYRFRSRLEARWAYLFDALAVEYQYESEGFDLDGVWYLPDFWLPNRDMWVEVKGGKCNHEDYKKIVALRNASGKDVVLVGDIPAPGQESNFDWGGAQREIQIDENWPERMIGQKNDPDNYSYGDWGRMLHCPVCLFGYVHIGNVVKIDCDDYSAWAGRGGAVRINLWCENMHYWTVRLGFHKGNTFIDIEKVFDVEYDFPFMLAGFDWEKRDEACRAARSARFEHGESG